MPKTINQGFQELLNNLTPSLVETEAVKKHRESIKNCLESKFGLKNFFRTGSNGNGTSIRGYSDSDYFASIPTDKLKKDSSVTLREIKDVLTERFPNTGIYVDSPAVVCPFGNLKAETTEIVPADYLRQENGYNIYDIPDSKGEWMNAGPTAHNDYVSSINSKLDGKVKPLIRLIKAWKYYNNVPISSFFIEIKVVKYAEKETYIDYSIDIYQIVSQLLSSNLASIIDPTGISGYIYPCSSTSKKDEALSKLNTAKTRIENARLYEKSNNLKDSFYWWDRFYNGNFPLY